MKKIDYPNIKETLYHETLDNGLEVYIVPKPGFSKYFATFTTKYGSIDNKFIPIGETDYIKVPDGIAHFLEHKMFESETGGDVFEQFTKYSANSNAFTSFNRTSYLFSCTSHFEENLSILLDFVQEAHLTDENVEKEKGIIGQEIKMYDDNPDWRLYFGTIENMYKENGVRVDIAGTVDSISQIDKETLYKCYNTFYHPANMLLFVVGDVNVDATLDLIKQNQAKKQYKSFEAVKRDYIFETNEVHKKEEVLKMDVFTPKVAIGVKDHLSKRQGKELMKYEILMDIVFDYLFSKSSPIYQELLDEELINESFSYELTFEYSHGFAVISTDTKKPEAFRDRIKDILLSAKTFKMSEEDFTIHKNKLLGQSIKALNSTENIANSFTRYRFNEMNMFEAIEIYEELTLEDLSIVNDFFDEKAITTMMILPKDKA